MHRHIRLWLLAFAMAVIGLGCRSAPPEQPDEMKRQALEQRVRAFRDEAMRGGALAPARKAELQRLAADVRAWRAQGGQDDFGVGKASVTTARRANEGGGTDCGDCPGYRLDGDQICFLEAEGECPVEDDDADLTIGKICVYTCIWIGSGPQPAMQGGGKGGGSPPR